MFAVEQAEVCPDIICLGKALTGGSMSLAGTVVTDEVYSAFHSDVAESALMHGPTYMANPLACAAAIASLDLFATEPRMDQVASLARTLADAARDLDRLPAVVSARSLGALLAITFADNLPTESTRDWFVERGIWLRPIRNVLYTCPPFTIASDRLARVLEAMRTFAEGAKRGQVSFV